MPPGVLLITIVAVVALTSSGLAKLWLSRPHRSGIPQTDLDEIRDALRQLQNSVDTIALEVERLSEGQRFTTKLLAEQARKTAQLPSERL
jgi:cell division protein FtsB